MARPPLVAWYWKTGPWEEYCEVLFARSEAGARARMMREASLCWEDTEGQFLRAPELDPYAPGPLTDAEFWEAGWCVECACHCGHRVTRDGCTHEDEHEKRDVPVVDGDEVFCSGEHRDREMGRRALVRARKADALRQLREKCPWVVPLRALVGGASECQCFRHDRDNVLVHFRVPGGSVSDNTSDANLFHNTYCHGCSDVWVCRGDYAAFVGEGVRPDLVVESQT